MRLPGHPEIRRYNLWYNHPQVDYGLLTYVNIMYIIDLQKREVTGSVHCRKDRIEREDKAGIGYVDFIFYPETDKMADGIILELKVDHTADEALQQIKNKKYALKFEGKLGERHSVVTALYPMELRRIIFHRQGG